ncbi:MAG: thioredoxin-disulfide reductase [Anaerolineae bacterium]|nr:thioredoxin-disulfide reductase [Anaerolineae bacterium]
MEKVIIIGSGPAAYTAALYAGRAQLDPLIIAGPSLGGQVAISAEVGNYPGFPEDIAGAELAQRMQQQAERFGARLEMDIVTGVDLSQRPFKVHTYSGTYETHTLIIATGSSARKLGVPGEKELSGRGVSYCATCDGFFYMGKTIVIVGGGDAAVEEAMFLTRFAAKVYLVHRRDQLRAEKVAQERLFRNEKITVIWNSVVTEIVGNDHVTGVKLHNVKTGQEHLLPTDGVFVAIGHTPNTHCLGGQITLHDNGYIAVDEHTRTSVPGVFAVGDVADWTYRQIATSVGTGAKAGMQVEQYIAALEDRAYPGDTRVEQPEPEYKLAEQG